MTGDLHENVPVTQPTEGQVDSVYYVDVGDAPQVEDQRFLSRLMADSRVQGTNTREVVDAGMRAVAQREYFMVRCVSTNLLLALRHGLGLAWLRRVVPCRAMPCAASWREQAG
eukprot:SAG11_NODE_548_length_8594_cov_5.298293_2_plen_113_part_00